MKNNRNISVLIEALSKHEDSASLEVLERLGTNSQDDEVRRLTSKALVSRNTQESLSLVILESGKGINDLSTSVAMSTINELLSLEDKTEALSILLRVEQMDLQDEVKETANSVKTLMAYS